MRLFCWGCDSHRYAALALGFFLLPGCLEVSPSSEGHWEEPPKETTDLTPPVPSAHPCPEWASPPLHGDLWHEANLVPLAFRFPFPAGFQARISQSFPEQITHGAHQRYAWDFEVPYGTPIVAAASGTVVWVEDQHEGSGSAPSWTDSLNYLILDHGGGIFTQYAHLAQDSALVLPGDWIPAGTQLASTGASGYLTGPHLHFQVENTWSQSLPNAFVDESGCNFVPLTGEWIIATDAPLAANTALSPMPSDTFADLDISHVEGLPARLFEQHEELHLSGLANRSKATHAYFLIADSKGGEALYSQSFELSKDGSFRGRVSLDSLPAGSYSLALIAGTRLKIEVPRSVRATIVE